MSLIIFILIMLNYVKYVIISKCLKRYLLRMIILYLRLIIKKSKCKSILSFFTYYIVISTTFRI